MRAEIILTDNNINIDLNEPVIDVSTEDGISVTIIGGVGPQGAKGDDYVLTEGDKDDIAELAAGKVDLQEYVRKTDYPQVNRMVAGVVKVDTATGISADAQGLLCIYPASGSEIKAGTNSSRPITPKRQYISTFYGLAKAAGVDEKDSELEFGAYTDAAKTAIRAMLGAISLDDISEAPVQDVHVNGSSILDENGVADIPIATTSKPGVVKAGNGLYMQGGAIHLNAAPEAILKRGDVTTAPVVSSNQHIAVFYGLAKAAGADMASSENPVGAYTDAAKTAIQMMLGVPSTADIPDVSGYATKADTVLSTTLSRGRVGNAGVASFAFGQGEEASGTYSHAEGFASAAKGDYGSHAEGYSTFATGQSSHAEGRLAEASGNYSHAEGRKTNAAGANAHAEGRETTAGGSSSHAEGYKTQAIGSYSHAEGASNIANGTLSHAEGQQVIANGDYSHVAGRFNAEDTPDYLPEWAANTNYVYRDRVKVTSVVDGETVVTPYTCVYANNDAEFTPSNWVVDHVLQYAEIIGNGIVTARSNARALSWEGDERLMGNVYVGCNPDSSGGSRLAKVTEIPTVPVVDVQVNGDSILEENGIADIPIASDSNPGVVKVPGDRGLAMTTLGNITLVPAPSSMIKAGEQNYYPITPQKQHEAVFYGLAKAAGCDEKDSALPGGQYTAEARAAIQLMLGIPTITDIITAVHDSYPAAEEAVF